MILIGFVLIFILLFIITIFVGLMASHGKAIEKILREHLKK